MSASLPPSPGSIALRWLYIDFNSYFASVEQQLDPRLRGKPVAVIPVETESTCAIAASYEAKAFGITTGTPVHEARRRCPELICVLGRHENYVRYHQKIIDEVERHIPVSAVCSIDEIACELMENESDIEHVTDLAARIKAGLAENVGEYVRCSIGVAPNRYLSKIATDMQKPDGFTILQAHELPQRLLPLKLNDLVGVGRNMEKRLLLAGIGTMEQLLALSPARMRKVWGSIWGERMWYLLRGRDLPELETQRSSVGHSHVLAPELRIPERTRDVARRLTVKACSRLRRMEYFATHFSLSLRTEDGYRLALDAPCPRAQDNFTFLHLLDAFWQELLHSPHHHKQLRFKKVSIVLSGLIAEGDVQPELLGIAPLEETQRREKDNRLSHAMDKINQRYGRDTLSIGLMQRRDAEATGTKIAFTRIPDIEEFSE